MIRFWAFLMASYLVIALSVSCGTRAAVAVAKTTAGALAPPLPPAPTVTPATSDAVEHLTAERDDLRQRLSAIDSRLKSAHEEADARQLATIAAWILWIGILAIVAAIVLIAIGHGLAGMGATIAVVGAGLLGFSRTLAEYGHLLKYAGAAGAVGVVVWFALSHRKRAVAADASITAVEKLKQYADQVLEPSQRRDLLASITGRASTFIQSRRAALGLK